MKHTRGYTLVELMVAVGLFAVVMLLTSGAYLMMIALNRQAQGIATGIDDLSFATELMARNIRNGFNYSCGATLHLGDCPNGGSSFTFKDEKRQTVTYSLVASDHSIQETVNGVTSPLTDSSISITSLKFYVFGTRAASAGDVSQARVTLVISGTVSSSADKTPQTFTVETSATMRLLDI